VPAKVDKFTQMRWMAPSTMRLISGVCLPGTTQESGSGYHAIHLLTPETDRTTHYFFTAIRFGVFTSGDELNRQIQDKIAATRRFAFEEQDAPVIEAQQRIIDGARTAVDPTDLSSSVPRPLRQVLQRLIAAEQATTPKRPANLHEYGTPSLPVLEKPQPTSRWYVAERRLFGFSEAQCRTRQ
jgi:vanillate O-demethylase monooxygenase subunit